jgi:glycosyltransferase involved in cell wall biosynthesis
VRLIVSGINVQVALLITTYNRPDALNLVLESVARQSRLPDEVIICDDGSDQNTSAVMGRWFSRLPIHHCWCPDNNFRAALTRNLGILKSRADLFVFVDGDCLLPPSFIENHLKMAKSGYLIAGGRHLLSPKTTRLILRGDLLLSSMFKGWKFLNFPLGPLRDISPGKWEAVRTCNLSVCREDAIRIGGFDESYVGWGREDSDFVVRLLRLGVKIRLGRLAACVAHLHHPENSRAQLSVNDQRFREALTDPHHVRAKSSILYL